jgi:hypothetical protein
MRPCRICSGATEKGFLKPSIWHAGCYVRGSEKREAARIDTDVRRWQGWHQHVTASEFRQCSSRSHNPFSRSIVSPDGLTCGYMDGRLRRREAVRLYEDTSKAFVYWIVESSDAKFGSQTRREPDRQSQYARRLEFQTMRWSLTRNGSVQCT